MPRSLGTRPTATNPKSRTRPHTRDCGTPAHSNHKPASRSPPRSTYSSWAHTQTSRPNLPKCTLACTYEFASVPHHTRHSHLAAGGSHRPRTPRNWYRPTRPRCSPQDRFARASRSVRTLRLAAVRLGYTLLRSRTRRFQPTPPRRRTSVCSPHTDHRPRCVLHPARTPQRPPRLDRHPDASRRRRRHPTSRCRWHLPGHHRSAYAHRRLAYSRYRSAFARRRSTGRSSRQLRQSPRPPRLRPSARLVSCHRLSSIRLGSPLHSRLHPASTRSQQPRSYGPAPDTQMREPRHSTSPTPESCLKRACGVHIRRVINCTCHLHRSVNIVS